MLNQQEKRTPVIMDMDALMQIKMKQIEDMRKRRDADPVIQKWIKGKNSFVAEDYSNAVKAFQNLNDQAKNAKYLFNLGIIRMKQKQYDDALGFLTRAIKTDKFLGCAWFARATCHHLLQDFPLAILDYTKTLEVIRDNTCVNYKQLGNEFCLHRAEILFNRAIALCELRLYQRALEDLRLSRRFRSMDEQHQPISDVYAEIKLLQGTGAGKVWTDKDLLKNTKSNAQKKNVNPLMDSMMQARARLKGRRKKKKGGSSTKAKQLTGINK